MARHTVVLGPIALLVFAVALFLGTWEPWQHGYEGDGQFTDHGWREGSDRYELQLGELVPNPDRPARATFEVGRLPDYQSFGLRFRLADYELSKGLRTLRVRARIVERVSGRTMLDYDGPLDPLGGAPMTFSSRRGAADVEVLTAKFDASIPRGEPLSVAVDFPAGPGWKPRRPVEIVFVGGGWQ